MKKSRSLRIGLLSHFGRFIPDPLYLKIRWMLIYKNRLNMKDPHTFCEKIQWLKLYNRNPLYTMLVDKYEVKKYVADKIGEQYIIPTLGVWHKFEDIDFDNLPDQFILKTTNGSHTLIKCEDKKTFDKKDARKKFSKWLKISPYNTYREWAYKNVEPRIIAEKYMVDGFNKELTDYKFFCFNGRAAYCQVISDRSIDETIDFYDRDWVHQEFVGLNPRVKNALQAQAKPYGYSDMVRIAEKLSEGIPFVRVDLYSINDRIYFGEMTFYPAAGEGAFTPEIWNRRLGDMIVLPTKYYRE